MQRSTLPRHARAHAPGWAHPYASGPWSPVLYADGGEDDPEGGEPDPAGDEEGEEVPADDGEDDLEGGEPDPDGAEALGDRGKRALASMKGKWHSEREKRKALEEQLAAKDGADEAENTRRQAEADALSKANTRILKAEIRAAAKGRLNDPKDALTFLDLDQFEVGEDGEIDPEEIEDAIEDLLKAKPYLAAATVKRFQGTGDGGAARKASRPKQLTRADLKSMSPEAIEKARIDGRLDDLMGGK
ncbi:hypothetical protein OG393_21005 [Streptomyces sp. NBC_01216]|uniref:hypothetical protein n=1 Tax=Streptomyces sp. NBC_01216 TaxID=2903778 RepID=UPI002E153936|nr:hypothetical protein OG393_21005 [Streptomyces sp. NBC_01216]